MHATVEQLLNLRDENLVDAEVSQHVAQCNHCAAEFDALKDLASSLQELPMLEPSAHLFSNIIDRAGVESSSVSFEWLKLGIAASLVAALSILLMQNLNSPVQSERETQVAGPVTVAPVDQLMAQSAELESELRRVSYGARSVIDVRTADTIVALEDKLALVDYRLSQGRLTQRQRQHLWQERVRLMDSLLRVHYARMQRNSY